MVINTEMKPGVFLTRQHSILPIVEKLEILRSELVEGELWLATRDRMNTGCVTWTPERVVRIFGWDLEQGE